MSLVVSQTLVSPGEGISLIYNYVTILKPGTQFSSYATLVCVATLELEKNALTGSIPSAIYELTSLGKS